MARDSRTFKAIMSTSVDQAVAEHVTNKIAKLEFRFVKPDEFKDINADDWANTDILITDQKIPDPQIAPNLSWIQFYKKFDAEKISAYREFKPNILFTTAEGTDLHARVRFCLHHLTNVAASPNNFYNATVGIIGYESLGRELARVLKTFHCTILSATTNAMDLSLNTFQPSNTGDPDCIHFDRLYPIQALPSMVSLCDLTINTLPFNGQIEKIVNEVIANKVKPGSYWIDVAFPEAADIQRYSQIFDELKVNYIPFHIKDMASQLAAKKDSLFLELLQLNCNRFLHRQALVNTISPGEA